MRAWQVGATGALPAAIAPVERPVPEPGPGEVRIRVAAAGLGLPDVLMCRGEYAFEPPLPFVPGQEVAGIVDAVGEGVAVAVGERVMGVTSFYTGHGGLAEFCIAPAFSLYPVPEGMDDVAAAAFTIPYHTAWVGLKLRGDLRAGETLLVHGAAGGTGAAGIRLGIALGAQVIAVAGGDEKAAYCRAAGAQQVIDHREEDFVARVLELTAGRGADVVYDPVGGETFERSVACTAPGGRLLAVGFACGRWGRPDTGQLVLRNCAALGVYVGAHDRDEMLRCHADLSGLVAEGSLALRPDAVIGFDAIGDYLGRLDRREFAGKAVAAMG